MSYCILIRGPLGSGKTTIARALADKISAQYISIDKILDDNHLTQDVEEGYISQKSFLKANEIIIPSIRERLEKGIPAVVDGNFYWQSQIDDLIKKLDYQSFVFTLHAPLELCIERDKKRDVSCGEDATEAVYKKVTEIECGKSIDATQPVDVIVGTIVKEVTDGAIQK